MVGLIPRSKFHFNTDVIPSFTRFHPVITDLKNKLFQGIISLPVKGPLYTAIFPVWPLFIAATTCSSTEREALYQHVVPICEGVRNTLPAVLNRVSGLRSWLASQDPTQTRKDGWWDEMLHSSSSTTAVPVGRLLCLG